MKILKAFKYRIYPTKEQQILLGKTFGCVRHIFNHYLELQIKRYQNKEKLLSHFDINYLITDLKKEREWLKEVDSQALQASAENLSVAYKNFFNSVSGKRKGKKVSPPKFKNKNSRQSYRTPKVRINEDGSIHLPKLKSVKAVIDREIPEGSVIKSGSVSRNTDGKHYVSILVEVEVEVKPVTGNEIGYDLGLKDLLITSEGLKFAKPNELPNIARTKRLLKRAQKQLARTKKISKNHEQLRLKVAKYYSKSTRQRNEYYHILSKYLVDNYDSIYAEDLAVKNMIKNRKLSRAIHEVAWSTFTNMLSYKASWAGRTYHKISRWYPSSKTCSSCEYKLDKLDLGTREWTCPSCGVHHDRDINAANNILRIGQIDCYGEVKKSQAFKRLGEIPKALQKMASKIERSGFVTPVSHGSEQVEQLLAA